MKMMQNQVSSRQKKTTALVLLGALIATILVSLIASKANIGDSRQGHVQGRVKQAETESGSGYDCDILGIEYGMTGNHVANVQRDFSEYFQFEMGVASTSVYTGTGAGEVVTGINDAGTDVHLVRLGSIEENFTPEAAAAKIEEIFAAGDAAAGEFLIMPVNEPRAELAMLDMFSGVTEEGEAGGKGITEGAGYSVGKEWMNALMDNLKSSNVAGVSDTSSYLVFPAFNFHRVGNIEWATAFINGAFQGGEYSQADFHSFSTSIQYDSNRPLTKMRDEFLLALERAGVSGVEYSFYGMARPNAPFNEEAYQGFVALMISSGDEVIGVYFFSPWGWLNPEAGGNYNQPFPIEIWQKIFENCGYSEFGCGHTNFDDLLGLKSCETIDNDSVGPKRIEVREYEEPVGDIKYYIDVLKSQKIRFGLLGWISSTNFYPEEGESNLPIGTSTYPYLTPCPHDGQIVDDLISRRPISDQQSTCNNEILKVDMFQTFSAPIYTDTTTYPMTRLGSALSCSIWNHENTEIGSPTPLELSRSFLVRECLDEEELLNEEGLKKTFYETVKKLSKTKSIDRTDVFCQGLVRGIDYSDTLNGEEIITFDGEVQFTPETMCQNIFSGQIVTFHPWGSPLTPLEIKEICPGALPRYKPDAILHTAYYLMDADENDDDMEVQGLLEAMVQTFKEEEKQFPWTGFNKLIHRDRAGIKVISDMRAYDKYPGKKTGYKSELSSDEACKFEIYDGGGFSRVAERETEYIFPFVRQIIKSNAREGHIYTDYQVENPTELLTSYITRRREEIRAMINRYKAASGIEQDQMHPEIDAMISVVEDLYLCSDLDELEELVFDEELKLKIHFTDCLGKTTDVDPYTQWLCEQDAFKPLEKDMYCSKMCLSSATIEFLESQILEEVKGTLKNPIDPPKSPHEPYGGASHPGIDIGGQGDSVVATAKGRVIFTRNDTDKAEPNRKDWPREDPWYFWNAYGNMIAIDHGDYISIYAHLEKDSITVSEGDTVIRGQEIAKVGTTGRSDGYHLHFELRLKDGGEVCGVYRSRRCTVDPMEYFGEGEVPETPPQQTIEITPEDVPEEMRCEDPKVRLGIIVDEFGSYRYSDQDVGEFGLNLTQEEAVDMVLNSCGVKIPDCDESCFDRTEDALRRLAQTNINAATFNYLGSSSYSLEDIFGSESEPDSGIVDLMYENQTAEVPFQLMIAVWLGENGLNPLYKNSGFPSDIFGCGVKWPTPPQYFTKETGEYVDGDGGELDCFINRVVKDFYPANPGPYLESYGPISDGNGSFAAKALMVFEALAAYQGERDPRIGGDCNLYANFGNSTSQLEWAAVMLEDAFYYSF